MCLDLDVTQDMFMAAFMFARTCDYVLSVTLKIVFVVIGLYYLGHWKM